MADRTLALQLVTDVGSIKKDMKSVESSVGKAGNVMKGIGAGIVAGFALDTVVDFAKGAMNAASDLAEAQSKVGVVFDDSARSIENWARDAATSMGLSTRAALEAAGTYGNLFDALGLTEQASAEMSTSAVQLASDLASFNNTGVEETLAAIQSGLLGEAEPMRRFGSNLSAARVDAYLMAEGVVASKDAITDAMRVTARYELILKDTANAQGDFARTADGMANSQRTAAAKAEDLNAKVGQLLMPIGELLVDATTFAIDVIIGLGEAFHDLARFIDPAMAEIEDIDDSIREMAEARGLDADAIVDWVQQQRKARKAAEDEANAIEDLHWQAHLLALDFQRSTGVWDDGVQTQQELEAEAASVTSQMRAQGYMVDAATGNWVEFEETADGIIIKVPEAEKAISSYTKAQRLMNIALAAGTGAGKGIGVKVKVDLPAKGTVFHNGVEVGESAIAGVRQGLRDGRAEVRSAMYDVTWVMEHPHHQHEYKMWLLGRAGSKKVQEGLRSDDPDLRTAARHVLSVVRTELVKNATGFYTPGREAALSWEKGFKETLAKRVMLGAALGGLNGGNVGQNYGGTPYWRGGLTWVGERGPELVNLPRGSAVWSASESSRMGGGGSTTIVNVDISAGVAGDPVSIGREVDRVLRAYRKRAGIAV